jgi:hypothetical protein
MPTTQAKGENMDEDFLDAVEADNLAEAGIEAPQEPTNEAKPEGEQPAAAPVAESPVEPQSTPAAQPEPEAMKNVPLSALLDERDRRRIESDRVALLEQQIREMTQASQPQPQAPDPLEDPEGYNTFIAQQFEQRIINQSLNTSEVIARQAYGDDLVNKAQQWAKPIIESDPNYFRRLTSSAHPYAQVIADYQRATALDRLGDAKGVDDFLAWREAQAKLTADPQPAAPAAPATNPIPPRSIASATSAGGVSSDVIEGDDEIFDGMFKRT